MSENKQKTKTTKVWQLCFVAGNPGIFHRKIIRPGVMRGEAMSAAKELTQNNPTWRVWVQHMEKGDRIFESENEHIFQNSGYFIDDKGVVRSIKLPAPRTQHELMGDTVMVISEEGEREVMGEFTYHEHYPSEMTGTEPARPKP